MGVGTLDDVVSVALPPPQSLAWTGGAERDEAFMAVVRHARQVDAWLTAAVDSVARSESYADDHHRSPEAWVQAVTNSTRAEAVRRVREARLLRDLPALARAAAAGDVGAYQLGLLGKLHANERCREHMRESEALFVDTARTLRARDFATVCRRWEACADPDGAHRDHELSRENRRVRFSRLGAGFVMRVEGDALSGDILRRALDEHAQAEFDLDVADRAATFGDRAGQHALARTASQREFDALMVMCVKAAQRTAGSGREPLVNIFTTPEYLIDAIRQHATPECAPPAQPPTRLTGYAETADGAPVDPRDLVVAALVGQVRRVLVDTVGRVIDLGRRSRLFTGAAREAVLLAGNRCTHPGCECRGAPIQIDHLLPWARDRGPTNPANGGSPCAHHNRAKHTADLRVMLDRTGWHTYRSDGTEIAPRSRPIKAPDPEPHSDPDADRD